MKSHAKTTFASAISTCAEKERSIRILLRVTAELLTEMHGEQWCVDIDHAKGFVLLRISPQ
ncbi:MAG: hypothetical protein JWM58_2542 [Rhizobium sp.]|nr:hypothetical protein [Rhizobium sp.]